MGLIVIIEDEADIAWMEQLQLQSEGLEVKIFSAVERARYQYFRWEQVSAVVLDIMMPAPNGKEILAWLSENKPHIRTVVVTAIPDLGGNGDFPQADIVLRKPYDRRSLIEAVTGD